MKVKTLKLLFVVLCLATLSLMVVDLATTLYGLHNFEGMTEINPLGLRNAVLVDFGAFLAVIVPCALAFKLEPNNVKVAAFLMITALVIFLSHFPHIGAIINNIQQIQKAWNQNET